MSTDDAPGTRSIRLEQEVPGTPEQVWEAVATGPGISAWFVRAEVEPREGGTVSLDFGMGEPSAGQVTTWDPPRRFVYGSFADDPGAIAYEFGVEAGSGGTCVVRLIASGFGTGAEFDGEYDGQTGGWKLFLSNLRLYLTHFAGQHGASVVVNGSGSGANAEVWRALTSALGLPADAAEGERVQVTAGDAPALAGTVEPTLTGGMLALLLDTPAPGIGFVAAEGEGEHVYTSVYLYLFGDEAPATATRDERDWQAWMQAHFPMPQVAAAEETSG